MQYGGSQDYFTNRNTRPSSNTPYDDSPETMAFMAEKERHLDEDETRMDRRYEVPLNHTYSMNEK
jgi:hypothetical protein